jgi:hypothetical protein
MGQGWSAMCRPLFVVADWRIVVFYSPYLQLLSTHGIFPRYDVCMSYFLLCCVLCTTRSPYLSALHIPGVWSHQSEFSVPFVLEVVLLNATTRVIVCLDSRAGGIESKYDGNVSNCHTIHYAPHLLTLNWNYATHSLTHSYFHFHWRLSSETRPSPSEALRWLLRSFILQINKREGNVALFHGSAPLPEKSFNGTESKIQNRKLSA